MIKVVGSNCKDLKFKVCGKCNSLLQFKERDISLGFKGSNIISKVKCPNCLENVEITKSSNVNLKNIKKLTDVAKENNINIRTLQDRLNKLQEGEDYIKLGKRMPTILSPTGVEKILK